MRFFSNDSDDTKDQSNVDVQTRNEQVNADQAHDDAEHPEHVQSDPVAVPQQRSGSPWSDAPGSTDDRTDDQLSDQERAGDDRGPDESAVVDDRDPFAGPDEGAHRVDEDDRNEMRADTREEPVDLPLDDDRSDDTAPVSHDDTVTDARDDTVTDARDDTGTDTRDDTVADARDDTGTDADTASGTTTTYGPDGTVVTRDEDEVDSATAAGDADTEADVDRLDGDPALKDAGDFDDPTAVDPATDKPLDTDEPGAGETNPVTDTANERGRDDVAAGEAVPVPVPVGAADTTADASAAAKPGSVTEPDLGSLFGEADAQSFHERWRDVQLRFVDSPREATTEAARLVDEAVDKLTASLKAQKGTVSGESDDTEQLRVALRGYRDILNRILGL
jgi:hypothetical protein